MANLNYKSKNNQKIDHTAALKYLKDRYPWVADKVLHVSLAIEEFVASKFGPSALGYSRMASVTDKFIRTYCNDIELDCFASPLSARCDKFCSVDPSAHMYGGNGSIFNYNIVEKVLFANPPTEINIITDFLKKISSMNRLSNIKLYLFVPDWPDMDDILSEWTQYKIDDQLFTIKQMRDEELYLDGNPSRFGQIWPPAKPRRLLTFNFYKNAFLVHPRVDNTPIACEIVKQVLYTIPEMPEIDEIVDAISLDVSLNSFGDIVNMCGTQRISHELDRYFGIGSDQMIARKNLVFYKLTHEFAGPLEIKGSSISIRRQQLNELLLGLSPCFFNFESLTDNEQEDILRSSMSLLLSYKYEVDTSGISTAIFSLYDKWLKDEVQWMDISRIAIKWYKFMNTCLSRLLEIIVPFVEHITYEHYSLYDPYDEVCLDTTELILLEDGHAYGEYKNNCKTKYVHNSKYSKSILYYVTSSTHYDYDTVNNILDDFDTLNATGLFIICFEVKAMGNFKDLPEIMFTKGEFFNTQVHYGMLRHNWNVPLYNESRTVKYVKLNWDRFIDVVHNSIITFSNLGADLELLHCLLVERPYTMEKLRHTIVINTHILALIESFCHSQLDPVNHLLQLTKILRIVDNHREGILINRKFAIDHPIQESKKTDEVDLYLNDMSPSLTTFMFNFIVLVDKLSFPDKYTFNFLNRKTVTVAKFVDLHCRLAPPCMHYIYEYKWVHPIKRFFSHNPLAHRDKIVSILFFEIPDIHTGCYGYSQILEYIREDGEHYYKFVSPKCQAVVHYVKKTNNFDNDMTDIYFRLDQHGHSLRTFSCPNFKFIKPTDTSKYGCNIREVSKYISRFGHSIDGLLDILDEGFSRPSQYLDHTSEVSMRYTNDTITITQNDPKLAAVFDDPLGCVRHGINIIIYLTLNNTDIIQTFDMDIPYSVPDYYFDIFRDLSKRERTLGGAVVNYHHARILYNDQTYFPCPATGLVFNSKIGHVLSGGIAKAYYTNVTNYLSLLKETLEPQIYTDMLRIKNQDALNEESEHSHLLLRASRLALYNNIFCFIDSSDDELDPYDY